MLKSPLPSRARRTAGASAIALLAVSAVCVAWAASPPADLVEKPRWVERPGAADVARVYPAEPRALGRPGQVVMTCRVDGELRLRDCTVEREEPVAAGFGGAALALAQKFRMEASDGDGGPVAGRQVRIPIRFIPPSS